MAYEVEYTDEFEEWWDQLPPDEQNSISSIVGLLETMGPRLGAPYSSAIFGSRYGHMRELRIQHGGRPFRVLYAFDPRRVAILLLGGDKTGDRRWYSRSSRWPTHSTLSTFAKSGELRRLRNLLRKRAAPWQKSSGT